MSRLITATVSVNVCFGVLLDRARAWHPAGPRRWLWRRTVGRFRSEEAVYKSAERQYQTLAETLDGQVCVPYCAAELHTIRHARSAVSAARDRHAGCWSSSGIMRGRTTADGHVSYLARLSSPRPQSFGRRPRHHNFFDASRLRRPPKVSG